MVPGEWTVSFVAPLIWREFRTRVDDRVITGRVQGLGDLSVGARMRYLWWVPGDDSQQGASLSAAVIFDLPTGRSGDDVSGKSVPRDLQTGRGSYGVTFVNIGAYTRNRLELIQTTSFSFRSVGIGGSGYDFGDEISASFEFKYRVIEEKYPGNTMFLMLGLKYTHIDYDRDNGRRVKDTGSQTLYVQPMIQWHPRPWWELKGIFDVPFYRNGHGIQLVEELSFRFSVSWRFAT